MGKTTAIRELARYLADEMKKRVVLVDTSNEIGGDGDIPHEGVGSSRRMQVKNTFEQHKVMIEAVEVGFLPFSSRSRVLLPKQNNFECLPCSLGAGFDERQPAEAGEECWIENQCTTSENCWERG